MAGQPKYRMPGKGTNIDNEIQSNYKLKADVDGPVRCESAPELEIRMVNYIEQDGLEKVEEIYVKSEEEFMIEKNKHRDKEIMAISHHYDRLERKVTRETQAEFCRITHSARLQYLEAQNHIMAEIRKNARERLNNVNDKDNADAYRKVFIGLMVQGLFKMLDSKIKVKVREADKSLAERCLEDARKAYKDSTGKAVELSIHCDYLPSQCIGGMILISENENITVDNTLEARLYVLADKPDCALLPEYRHMLFGSNPNRKHFD